MNEPTAIWLEPIAALNPNYNRSWCGRDVWDGEGVKYVHHDRLEAAEARLEAINGLPDIDLLIDAGVLGLNGVKALIWKDVKTILEYKS